MFSQGIFLYFSKQLCFHVSWRQVLIWNLKVPIWTSLQFFWIGTSDLGMYHLQILLEQICSYFPWKQKTWFSDVFRGNRRSRSELICLSLLKLHAEFGGVPQIWIWISRKIGTPRVIISWTLFALQLLYLLLQVTM